MAGVISARTDLPSQVLVMHQRVEEATRTSKNGALYEARAVVEGRMYSARSRRGAPFALARILVEVGVSDRAVVVTHAGLPVEVTYRSLYWMAGRTIEEGARTSVRDVRYREFPEGGCGGGPKSEGEGLTPASEEGFAVPGDKLPLPPSASKAVARRLARRSVSYQSVGCAYCGEPADTLDHVVPYLYAGRQPQRSRGGRDPGKTAPACRACNLHLSSRLFRTFEERRNYVRERRGLPLFREDRVDPQPVQPIGGVLRESSECRENVTPRGDAGNSDVQGVPAVALPYRRSGPTGLIPPPPHRVAEYFSRPRRSIGDTSETDLCFNERLWLEIIGVVDVDVPADIIWGDVPVPISVAEVAD
jgi:hypothetical protein